MVILLVPCLAADHAGEEPPRRVALDLETPRDREAAGRDGASDGRGARGGGGAGRGEDPGRGALAAIGGTPSVRDKRAEESDRRKREYADELRRQVEEKERRCVRACVGACMRGWGRGRTSRTSGRAGSGRRRSDCVRRRTGWRRRCCPGNVTA